jgi:hypothetical protein
MSSSGVMPALSRTHLIQLHLSGIPSAGPHPPHLAITSASFVCIRLSSPFTHLVVLHITLVCAVCCDMEMSAAVDCSWRLSICAWRMAVEVGWLRGLLVLGLLLLLLLFLLLLLLLWLLLLSEEEDFFSDLRLSSLPRSSLLLAFLVGAGLAFGVTASSSFTASAFSSGSSSGLVGTAAASVAGTDVAVGSSGSSALIASSGSLSSWLRWVLLLDALLLSASSSWSSFPSLGWHRVRLVAAAAADAALASTPRVVVAGSAGSVGVGCVLCVSTGSAAADGV